VIVGDPTVIAIESEITEAYESLTFLALGFFLLHIGGHSYGRRSPDSTMLGCSFGAVEKRIVERGRHIASFAAEADAGEIADAFRNAIYAEQRKESYFGIPLDDFCSLFADGANDCMWAPDGDEAFDDSSYVLQFDVGEHVRIIAFKTDRTCCEECRHDPETLCDVWLAADEFYGILKKWRDAFLAEWRAAAKVKI
jgi:hypothetical protein